MSGSGSIFGALSDLTQTAFSAQIFNSSSRFLFFEVFLTGLSVFKACSISTSCLYSEFL